MIIIPNYPNYLDPNGATFASAIGLPYRFTVENLDRRIVVYMKVYASADAISVGAPHVGEAIIEIAGSDYYDIIESKEATFLDIAATIDSLVLQQGIFPNAIQGPVELPQRPE